MQKSRNHVFLLITFCLKVICEGLWDKLQPGPWLKIKATGTKFVPFRNQSVTKWNPNTKVCWNEKTEIVLDLNVMECRQKTRRGSVSTKCSTRKESWQTWTRWNIDNNTIGKHGLPCCRWHCKNQISSGLFVSEPSARSSARYGSPYRNSLRGAS